MTINLYDADGRDDRDDGPEVESRDSYLENLDVMYWIERDELRDARLDELDALEGVE